LTGLLTNESTVEYLKFSEYSKISSLDITKNSKEDHRYVKRYTKKEAEDQLKKELKYFRGRCKSKIVIKPFVIMMDYPFKKKKSDSDIVNDKNIDEDFILVMGRLPKFRGTEQFKGKSYIMGQIAYLPSGGYDIGHQLRHFGIKIKKQVRKKIKPRYIRDLFDPIKNSLRTGKPYSIYKELPRKIIGD